MASIYGSADAGSANAGSARYVDAGSARYVDAGYVDANFHEGIEVWIEICWCRVIGDRRFGNCYRVGGE